MAGVKKPSRAGKKSAPVEAPVTLPEAEVPAVKIAVLLPPAPTLRMIRRAAELAAVLSAVEPASGERVEVTVGLAEPDDARWARGERRIRQRSPQTTVRHLAWTAVPVGNAERMFAGLDPALDFEGIDEVMVPRDWGWNFQDCTLWLCLADPGIGAVLPLRPTVYYSLGLPERYAPEIVADSIHDPYWARQIDSFRLWRQAQVVTSDPTAVEDLISYAGVRRERIGVVPDVIEQLPPLEETSARNPHALVWLLRGDGGDDLEACLAGFQIYRREGGTIDLIVAEEERPDAAGHPKAAALPDDLRGLYANLIRVTYRSLDELDRLLVRGAGLWSSQVAGGAGEHLLEAARAGLHVLAADYPLTRHIVAEHALSARLYPPGEALGIADALAELQQRMETPVAAQSPAVPYADPKAAFAFLLDRLLATARAR